MQPKFKPPANKYSMLVVLGGVAIAILVIAGLTWLLNFLSKNNTTQIPETTKNNSVIVESPNPESLFALQDSQSLKLPRTKVTEQELKATKVPYIPAKTTKLTSAEMEVAKNLGRL